VVETMKPYPLSKRFIDHKVINHPEGIYVRGDTYTNTIEGAFGNMKTGMRGVYKKISPHYLQSYLDEYAWRHNAKRNAEPLFEQLLDRAVRASLAKVSRPNKRKKTTTNRLI
jgi:hypothetical protein